MRMRLDCFDGFSLPLPATHLASVSDVHFAATTDLTGKPNNWQKPQERVSFGRLDNRKSYVVGAGGFLSAA